MNLNNPTSYQPRARVTRTAVQTIANGAQANLEYQAARFDSADFWEGVTNPDRLTVPSSGIYLVTVNVTWEANANGYRRLRIYHGATLVAANAIDIDSVITQSQSLTTILEMAAGEHVVSAVYQNSGGVLDIEQAAEYTPEFMICKLSEI